MKVLVTGGAGYIGSHVCRALAALNIEPVVLDNLTTGHEWAVQWGPLKRGDTRDVALVIDVLERHRIEAVFHFAALSLVAESVSSPLRYYDNNVSGTLSLLAAMEKTGVSRIIFSSTCAVYGIPPSLPIRETMPTVPLNPYGRSKLAAENAILDAANTQKLDAVILRYFNAAGAASDLSIGEAHKCETHLIPLAITAARQQSAPLKIFGTDYETRDGTCLRDYVHVSDLASAHVAALDFLQREKGGHYFNLGTGQPASVREVLRAVETALGVSVPTTDEARRVGDPPSLYASNEWANQRLGWKPQFENIFDIVQSAVAWDAKYNVSAVS